MRPVGVERDAARVVQVACDQHLRRRELRGAAGSISNRSSRVAGEDEQAALRVEREAARVFHGESRRSASFPRASTKTSEPSLVRLATSKPSRAAIPPSWPIQSSSSSPFLSTGGVNGCLRTGLSPFAVSAVSRSSPCVLSSLLPAARPGGADVGEDVWRRLRAPRRGPGGRGGPVAADPAAAADFLAVEVDPREPGAAFAHRAAEVDHRLAVRRRSRDKQRGLRRRVIRQPAAGLVGGLPRRAAGVVDRKLVAQLEPLWKRPRTRYAARRDGLLGDVVEAVLARRRGRGRGRRCRPTTRRFRRRGRASPRRDSARVCRRRLRSPA